MGCSRLNVPEIPDSNYFNITDASIRLIIKHDKDSLDFTPEEKIGHLPGHYCKKLEMINQLDSSKNLGVSIRFWVNTVANDNYGPYEKGGLIEKIKSIKVTLENGSSKIDITNLLKGDSSITDYLWVNTSDTLKPKLFHSFHSTASDCYKTFYYPNIDSLIKMGNSYEPESIRIYDWDFLFWMERDQLTKLPFKPNKLKVQILFDSKSTDDFKEIKDSVLLQNVP